MVFYSCNAVATFLTDDECENDRHNRESDQGDEPEWTDEED